MDRRKFLGLGGAALLQPSGVEAVAQTNRSSAAAPAQHRTAQARPNILMVMADQLRVDCVGAYGNKAIRTPNLDRIAREGIRFQNAYTSTPSCTPARTALMTGLSPWGHGMLGYSNMTTRPYPVEKASALAKAGYYTTAVGKNHYYPITNPHGYHHMVTDEHCSYWFHKRTGNQMQSYEPRCDYESWFWSQRPDADPHATGLGWNDQPAKPFVYPEELHATHWTGTTAERFLQQYDREEPFFLKVSFIRPHSPYDPPKRLFDSYLHADLPKARVGAWAGKYAPLSSDQDDRWHGKLSDEEIHRSRAGYYASVTFVDEQVGRLLAVLEERGMLDDTMIVFFSDHGDMLGDQNLWRKAYAYEQSAHIPLLLRPARMQQLGSSGQTFEQPVEIRDLLPTFLDAAGAEVPSSMEGKSLLQLVRGKGQGWRQWIDLEHNITYDATNHWNALTDGKWKYIFHAYNGDEQLFDLTSDPEEATDLSKDLKYASEFEIWRQRMVEHLSVRGPLWVKDGKLMVREKGQLLGPNFPGYAAEKEIAGWI
ncbi:arylsulfatase [Edaphobacter flagellatus]|uniref:arylsulfatase n=1 Tax=Edaphobacter flagellatus TaxID=1933044 RepID=UPI0021B17DB1|nr:arylsulfatase [Edaphobacter flagellatus]